MKISLFGATGALGAQCLAQAVEAGHSVTVLVRDRRKLADIPPSQVTVIEGDALDPAQVAAAIPHDTDAVMFAIGVVAGSPEMLCTDVNRLIFNAMAAGDCRRFIWCGGGSNFVSEDQITLGARFVRFFAATFMGRKHRDKEAQLTLLAQHPQISSFGVRPLQMNPGQLTGQYRLGFEPFSGLSKISFADCAHAMLGMLENDDWQHQAPIVQY